MHCSDFYTNTLLYFVLKCYYTFQIMALLFWIKWHVSTNFMDNFRISSRYKSKLTFLVLMNALQYYMYKYSKLIERTILLTNNELIAWSIMLLMWLIFIDWFNNLIVNLMINWFTKWVAGRFLKCMLFF